MHDPPYHAAAVASIAALGVASVASADSGHSAKPYKASLAAVNPAATTAGLATVVGNAQLVDGKKNNKVSLHVRNLAAGTCICGTCTRAPALPRAHRLPAGPTARMSARNGTLTSNESGNANTKGKSATFNADPAKSYSVNVHVRRSPTACPPAPSSPAVT